MTEPERNTIIELCTPDNDWNIARINGIQTLGSIRPCSLCAKEKSWPRLN
jgi:hypothetical protein